mmetsp:Transcript_2563/g.3626  ORF Transcript_2563/g.3626 Transcript_2563/m.3626 type:complete len:106 (+) Transcript_2563:1718-2035(+)
MMLMMGSALVFVSGMGAANHTVSHKGEEENAPANRNTTEIVPDSWSHEYERHHSVAEQLAYWDSLHKTEEGEANNTKTGWNGQQMHEENPTLRIAHAPSNAKLYP